MESVSRRSFRCGPPDAHRYDASGWRTVTTQVGGPDTFVPFGLPGQLYLDRVPTAGATPGVDSTAAYASGSGFTHTRPPLMLNQWRVYDPLMGAYLQPDEADRSGRRDPDPEGTHMHAMRLLKCRTQTLMAASSCDGSCWTVE